MKWFDRWFYSKVRWANVRGGYEFSHLKEQEDILDSATEMYHSPVDHSETLCHSSAVSDSDAHDLCDGIRIDVKRLTGGYVVTFRHPYSKKSQNMNYIEDPVKNSYIIKEDDDFNDTLGKLLTMELLK